MQWACALLSSVARPALGIFPHYLINGTIFGQKVMKYKIFFLQLFSEKVLIPRKSERDIIINVL
jgi:hypothetical protein